MEKDGFLLHQSILSQQAANWRTYHGNTLYLCSTATPDMHLCCNKISIKEQNSEQHQNKQSLSHWNLSAPRLPNLKTDRILFQSCKHAGALHGSDAACRVFYSLCSKVTLNIFIDTCDCYLIVSPVWLTCIRPVDVFWELALIPVCISISCKRQKERWSFKNVYMEYYDHLLLYIGCYC